MILFKEKLYYINLPEGTRPLAKEILPIVRRTIRNNFKRLKEVLYIQNTLKPKQIYLLPITTDPSEEDFDSASYMEGDKDKQINDLAAQLHLYMSINENSLKLLALYNKPNCPEKPLLEKAIKFLSDRCHQQSSEQLKKIQLEELVAVY
jgi:hypothetical protein